MSKPTKPTSIPTAWYNARRDQVAELLNMVKELRQLHRLVQGEDAHGFIDYCKHDEHAWPCATTQIIDDTMNKITALPEDAKAIAAIARHYRMVKVAQEMKDGAQE